MYDSSAGGSGGWETKRERSYEQKRRNINSSSQCTITYSARFTVFLSYCVNETLRSRGVKATFPRLSARIWLWIPTLSSAPQEGHSRSGGQPRTNGQLEHKMHAKRRDFPKMTRQQKQRNVKALTKKLNYPVTFTSCSGQKATMVRVVHVRGEQVHP